MARYRKLPVVIEAERFDGTPGGAVAVFDVFDIPGAKFVPAFNDLERGYLAIPTQEGVMYARGGDWIIKGVKGEFYPCKSGIFEATYRELSAAEARDEAAIEASWQMHKDTCDAIDPARG